VVELGKDYDNDNFIILLNKVYIRLQDSNSCDEESHTKYWENYFNEILSLRDSNINIQEVWQSLPNPEKNGALVNSSKIDNNNKN